jgi:hypothetical protein
MMLDALREGHRLAARHLDPRAWDEDGRPDALPVLCQVDDRLESALLAVQVLAVEAEVEGGPSRARELAAGVRLAATVAAPWALIVGLVGLVAGWWS